MKLKLQQPSEKEVENSILSWLQYQPGVLAFKVNTAGVYDENRKCYRKAGKFVIKGTSDILCCCSILGVPIFVSMEVKTFTGRQSDDQKDFERRLIAVGGFYFIVRSIEDAQKCLNKVRTEIMGKLLR